MPTWFRPVVLLPVLYACANGALDREARGGRGGSAGGSAGAAPLAVAGGQPGASAPDLGGGPAAGGETGSAAGGQAGTPAVVGNAGGAPVTAGGRSGTGGTGAGGTSGSVGAPSGEPVARHHYGALLEPRVGVYHGVGQTYLGYLPEMAKSTGRQPALYTVYARIDTAESTWTRFRSLVGEAGGHALLVVSMMISSNYVQIADGALDDTVDRFAEKVAALGPCFVRIGYEVNGEWNDFYKNPARFVAAWKKIATALRSRSAQIATVWNIDRPTAGLSRYAAYYPGDEWVDWWSMDVWQREDFQSGRIGPFLADAHARKKPVMIPESTLKGTGGVWDIAKLDGDKVWNDWFVPYFRMIHENPGIKGFVYINWNWETLDNGIWKGWGNAHIQDNPVVMERYAAEVKRPLYLHGASLDQLRATWGD